MHKYVLRVGVKLYLEDVIFTGVLKMIRSHRSSLLPKILISATIIPLSLLLISTAWATPADDAASDGSSGGLEAQASELDASYNEALANLVAVDSEVDRYGSEIASASERRGQVQSDIESEQQRLNDLHDQIATQRAALEKRLCTTYKSDDIGYLDVILGAGDFNEFLNRVDMVTMIADDDRQLIEAINAARQTEEDKLSTLSQKQGELDGLITELSDAQASLLDAQAEQQSTVAGIEAEMQDNQSQLDALRAEASAIEDRMDEIQDSADEGGDDSPPPAGGTSMTMTATAYCLTGTTATGMPVGRGVIAVDPSVIPLGTRVHVSGYGDAIAADIGGAINGNIIDVWLPCADAYAWGTRTVEVTIY